MTKQVCRCIRSIVFFLRRLAARTLVGRPNFVSMRLCRRLAARALVSHALYVLMFLVPIFFVLACTSMDSKTIVIHTTSYTGKNILGPAIFDQILADDFVILTVHGLQDGEHSISFASMKMKKVSEAGILTITKSDIKYSNAREGDILFLRSKFFRSIELAVYMPYHIYTWQDLQAMRQDLAAYYILMNDIQFPLTGQNGFPHHGFEPIGTATRIHKSLLDTSYKDIFYGSSFSGTLDGNNKTISGLQIHNDTQSYVGLFAKIDARKDHDTIRNLILSHPHISARAMAGSLVGYFKQGRIVNVRVVAELSYTELKTTGSIVDTEINTLRYGYTGGLIGVVGTDAVAMNIQSQLSVRAIEAAVGGAVGYNMGIVTGCSSATVQGKRIIGGFVGINVGTVHACSSGTISGNDIVGGLIAYNQGDISGYSYGSLEGISVVGGLIGLNAGIASGYVEGAVKGESLVGGLVGINIGAVSGYMLGPSSGKSVVGGLVGSNVGVVTGYARGAVLKIGTIEDVNFGRLVGRLAGTASFSRGYSSNNENKIINIDNRNELKNTKGIDGVILVLEEDTGIEVFENFVFGTKIGQWTWVADGMWPAINIGSIYQNQAQELHHQYYKLDK